MGRNDSRASPIPFAAMIGWAACALLAASCKLPDPNVSEKDMTAPKAPCDGGLPGAAASPGSRAVGDTGFVVLENATHTYGLLARIMRPRTRLPTWLATNAAPPSPVRIRACLALHGWDPGAVEKEAAALATRVQTSMRAWLGLLAGHPDAARLPPMEVSTHLQAAECPANKDERAGPNEDAFAIGMNWYARHDDFRARHCPGKAGDDISCRSFADVNGLVVQASLEGPEVEVLDRSKGLIASQKKVKKALPPDPQYLVLHELGHVFGMGDAYKKPGEFEAVQAVSLMNGSAEFSDDDKMGFWVLFDRARGAPVDCGRFGDAAKVRENRAGFTVCDPKAQWVMTHGISASEKAAGHDRGHCVK